MLRLLPLLTLLLLTFACQQSGSQAAELRNWSVPAAAGDLHVLDGPVTRLQHAGRASLHPVFLLPQALVSQASLKVPARTWEFIHSLVDRTRPAASPASPRDPPLA